MTGTCRLCGRPGELDSEAYCGCDEDPARSVRIPDCFTCGDAPWDCECHAFTYRTEAGVVVSVDRRNEF